MKSSVLEKRLGSIAAGVSLLVIGLWAADSVHAGPEWTLQASIPFEFDVNGDTLPAGDYVVTYAQPGLVRIASPNGAQSAAALTLSNGSKPAACPYEAAGRLVFSRYGRTYVLSQVWRHGEGHELPLDRAKQETASRKQNPDTLTVELTSHTE